VIELYKRGLELDDLTEVFFQGLMRCYLSFGCPADAAAAYRRMRQVLIAILGVKPSADSERLHTTVLYAGGERAPIAAATM
jgi:two-component SAPR family response regulator